MHLLIPAAGSGSRMKAGKNKLLIELEGKSLIYWTLKSALLTKKICWVGIIGQPQDKEKILDSIKGLSHKINWIKGGKTRQESVKNGLEALPEEAKKVLIHDGARCLIKPELFDECAEKLNFNDAVIVASRVTDTIKVVNESKIILDTPNRSNLWAAQTPQGFLVSKLKEAHQIAIQRDWSVTDDASLFERLDWDVKVIEGSNTNIKITTPFDLKIGSLLLQKTN